MALTLLFYTEADAREPTAEELAEALEAVADIAWAAAPGAAYRPFRLVDPLSGAAAEGDLGLPPLVEDPDDRARGYEGWNQIALALHLPVAVPHWHCVELGRVVTALGTALPGLAVLNTEDIRRGAGEEDGPGPLLRDRLLSAWEDLHAAQTAELADLPRMDRLASIALWRYRREGGARDGQDPQLVWPEAMALGREGLAHGAAIRPVAERWALPPVEFLVIQRGEGAGLLPTALLPAHLSALSLAGGASLVAEDPELRRWFEAQPLQAITGYRALRDGDWVD